MINRAKFLCSAVLGAALMASTMGVGPANAVFVSIGVDADGAGGGFAPVSIASGANTVVSTAPGTVINGFSIDVTAAGNPPLFDAPSARKQYSCRAPFARRSSFHRSFGYLCDGARHYVDRVI